MRILRHKETPLKIKTCKFPGCTREFLGHPISKYCPKHSDVKARQQIKPPKQQSQEVVNSNNRLIFHEVDTIGPFFINCALKGCNKRFEITIYPKQFIYPNYCLEHRNPFKRKLFLETSVEKKYKKTTTQLIDLIDTISIPKNIIVKRTKSTVVLIDNKNPKFKLAILKSGKILLAKHFSEFKSFKPIQKKNLGFTRSIGEVEAEHLEKLIEKYFERLYNEKK